LAFTLYTKLPANLLGGETAGETGKIDWLSDTIKAALFTTSYTPAQDTDELYSSLTNEVANGNGYTTGGTSVTGTLSGTTTQKFSLSASPTFAASGGDIVARWAVLYEVGGSIIAYFLLDSTPANYTIPDGSTLTININASGIWAATAS